MVLLKAMLARIIRVVVVALVALVLVVVVVVVNVVVVVVVVVVVAAAGRAGGGGGGGVVIVIRTRKGNHKSAVCLEPQITESFQESIPDCVPAAVCVCTGKEATDRTKVLGMF